MVILDSALEKRASESNPVRVGIIGAGYIARGATNQILNFLPGMDVVAICNRTVSRAEDAYRLAGETETVRVETIARLDEAIAGGKHAVTDNPELICRAAGIDVVMDLVGQIEFGCTVSLDALRHGKHLIASAEVDSTLGPILKTYADQTGVVYTNCDGDQPGVIMNLLRWVRSVGFNPVLGGNLKGMLDPYRTPETQAAFAKANGITAHMATHFADGTKLAMEQAVVSNATGFRAGRRGMYGPAADHCDEAIGLFPEEQMLDGGLSDYLLGANPGPGVFVIGYNNDETSRTYAEYFKRGEGPFHVFYTPYHFPHIEIPLTAARAAIFNDPCITPLGAPAVEVITVAKTDLKAGGTLDGFGGFATYGLLDNYDRTRKENLLSISLSEGCVLKRDIPKDQVITRDDVTLPEGRLCDKLYAEQLARFAGTPCPTGHWNAF
jgi:predicted homoserine dehydrogenase-like protein